MRELLLELRLKNFSENPTEANYVQVLSIINPLSLTELSSYSKNQIIRNLLDLPSFVPFWQKKLASFKCIESPTFKFVKTQHISAQELTLGFFNFQQASQVAEKKGEFLARAMAFHSFHALREWANSLPILLKQQKEEQFAQDLKLLQEEARLHGTPGYLLLATLFLKCAAHLYSDKARTDKCLELVFTYLELAKHSEDDSQNDIHNAYFGQGISRSNSFKLSSLEEIYDACKEKFKNRLGQEVISNATHAGKLMSLRHERTPMPQDKSSAFYEAILADSPERMKAAFTPNQLTQINRWGETPLHLAVRLGKINSVRCLLSLESDRYTRICPPQKIYPALQIASCLNEVGIRRVLLSYAPDLEAQNDRELADQNIAQQGILEFNGNGSLKKIQGFLEEGGSPDFLFSGKTPLYHMLSSGNIEGIELLLNFGASLTQRNANGETVLFSLLEANDREHLKIYFRRFICLGADINAKNNEGETLLIKAIKKNDKEGFLFLLEQEGIDIDTADNHGKNASFYAQENQWVIERLEDKRRTTEKQKSATLNYQSIKTLFSPAKEEPVSQIYYDNSAYL